MYLKATDQNEKPGGVQVAIFLYRDNIKEVIRAFEEYCLPRDNGISESFKFLTRVQMSGESFDNFYTDLKLKAKRCNYDNQEDRMVRDRIVIDTADKSLQERLLRVSSLTLDETVKQARAAEIGGFQTKALQQENHSSSVAVAVVKKENWKPSEMKSNIFQCRRCG